MPFYIGHLVLNDGPISLKEYKNADISLENIKKKILGLDPNGNVAEFYWVKRLLAIYMVRNYPLNGNGTPHSITESYCHLLRLFSKVYTKEGYYRAWARKLLSSLGWQQSLFDLQKTLQELTVDYEVTLRRGIPLGKANKLLNTEHDMTPLWQLLVQAQDCKKKDTEDKYFDAQSSHSEQTLRARRNTKMKKGKKSKKRGKKTKQQGKKQLFLKFAKNPERGQKMTISEFAKITGKNKATQKKMEAEFDMAEKKSPKNLGDLIAACRLRCADPDGFETYLEKIGYNETLRASARKLGTDKCYEVGARNIELSAAKLVTMKEIPTYDEIVALLKPDKTATIVQESYIEDIDIYSLMARVSGANPNSMICNSYFQLLAEEPPSKSKAGWQGHRPMWESAAAGENIPLDNIKLKQPDSENEKDENIYKCFRCPEREIRLLDLLKYLGYTGILENVTPMDDKTAKIEEHFAALNMTIEKIVNYITEKSKNPLDAVKASAWRKSLRRAQARFYEFIDTQIAMNDESLKNRNKKAYETLKKKDMNTYKSAVEAVEIWKKIEKKQMKGKGSKKNDEDKNPYRYPPEIHQQTTSYALDQDIDTMKNDFTETDNIIKAIDSAEKEQKNKQAENKQKANHEFNLRLNMYKY